MKLDEKYLTLFIANPPVEYDQNNQFHGRKVSQGNGKNYVISN